MKPFSVNLSGKESLKPLEINKFPIKFVDIQEYDNYDDKSFKINLMKTIDKHSPSRSILKLLENKHFNNKEEFFGFLLQNKHNINWYNEVTKILLDYSNK